MYATSILSQLSKMGKITGPMSIDEYGRRQIFDIQILDFQQPSIVETAYWNSDGLHFLKTEQELESYLYKNIQEKMFKISTRVVCNVIFINALDIKEFSRAHTQIPMTNNGKCRKLNGKQYCND